MAVAANRELIRPIVNEYIRRLQEQGVPVWRVYLFGSYVNGTAGAESDIDLAVFLDKADIEGFSEDVDLMRHRWEIDLRIEPHAFARSDFDDPDPFVQEILSRGEQVL